MASQPQEEEGEEAPTVGEVTWAGMTVVSLKSDIAQSAGVEREKGVFVSSVDVDSPAHDAGIAEGDIITKVGKIEIVDLSDFKRAKKEYKDSKKPVIMRILKRVNSTWIPRIVAVRVAEQ